MGFSIISAKEVKRLTECIYVRYHFDGEFILLLNMKEEPFTDMDSAQSYLRKNVKGLYWEISTYEQALINNGMRSNA